MKVKEDPDKKPVFLWASPIDYKFNDSNKVDTKNLEKNEYLKDLDSFTIFTQFKVEKMKSKDGEFPPVLIVGHSD